MLMIQTRFIKPLTLAALVLTASWVHAQNAGPSTGSGESGVAWPRTFTGQPDFAFTREEVLKEAKGRAVNGNEPLMGLAPTLAELSNDETRFDPLGLAKLSSATTVSRTDTSPTAPAQTLMEKLLANASALPSFSTSYTVDMNEFSTTLNQTIRSTVSGWKPDKTRYSYEGLIGGLTLQAVVTSPVRYAIINGQRYGEGDTFQLKVPVNVPDAEITEALRKKLPVSGTVPASAYEQYEAAYENAIAAFAEERNRDPAVGRQDLSLPVTVQSIQPRKVKLGVNGEEHELLIKFSY